MRHFVTQGIILKKKSRGENDNLILIFSPEIGKFQAISKSSRKITSSFIGHLETLNICNFQVYKTTHNYTITQCQLYKSYKKIQENLDKMVFALLTLEIIQKSIESEHHHDQAFELLISTLDEIENELNYEFIVENFKIKLLQLLGSLPEIALCFFCSKKWEIEENIWLDQEGHLTCYQCLNKHNFNSNKFENVPFKLIKLINYISQNHFEKPLKIELNSEQKFQLKKIVNTFLNNYLYQELNSEKIITKLRSI